MKKLVEFFKNDHIQISLGTGICILILAFVFKKVLHTEVKGFDTLAPSFVFLTYEGMHGAKKLTKQPWSRPWFWNMMALLVTGAVIARRMWLMD